MTNFARIFLREINVFNEYKILTHSRLSGYGRRLSTLLPKAFPGNMESQADNNGSPAPSTDQQVPSKPLPHPTTDKGSKSGDDRVRKLDTRYNGRIKKRRWEEQTEDSKKKFRENFERVKRKKVAMLLSYSGVNYFGMQRNPKIKTIEEDFLKALLNSKHITDEAFEQIQTINFQRAARTDKGVSAVRQVVSLKMPDKSKISEINEHLPPEIRAFAIKRVTKGFNAKSQCDARTYTYMLPTFSFEKHYTVIEDVMKYRTSEDVIVNFNEILKAFIGTKNYHNFTSKKEFVDPSSKRFMVTMECGAPFVVEGMEFAVIRVKGQSFMMHQIRKMVGLSLAIVRGLTTQETMERAFTADRLDLPMAPGLGLALDQVHYDRYNERYGQDGFHDALTWEEVEKEVNEFKEKYIYPTIIKTEMEEKSMENWLLTLGYHSYDVREGDKKVEEDNELDSDDEGGPTPTATEEESLQQKPKTPDPEKSNSVA